MYAVNFTYAWSKRMTISGLLASEIDRLIL